MPLIEGIRVQGYRALRDLTLGRLWNKRDQVALTPLVAVIGKNGSGKSTLFDAFGFLSDCLSLGVEDHARQHWCQLLSSMAGKLDDMPSPSLRIMPCVEVSASGINSSHAVKPTVMYGRLTISVSSCDQ